MEGIPEHRQEVSEESRIMTGYYSTQLAAERLEQCYALAPPRVQQYLQAEVAYALKALSPGDSVLELGCGYGRILQQIANVVDLAVGIDTSMESLRLARQNLPDELRVPLLCMDASRLAFTDRVFDCVLCLQNGISAFHVDRLSLFRECIRVTKLGGRILFSTYSDKFWAYRLQWFEAQAQAGLLGPIDYEKTGRGNIVCTDGFTATTVGPDEFIALAACCGLRPRIIEVDASSLLCELVRT